MDRELIEFFEGKFNSVESGMERLRAELRAELREETGKLRQEVTESRLETERRFDKLEGKIRQSHVLTEDVRSDVKGVAEGVVAVREELAQHRVETEAARRDDKAFLISLFRHGRRSTESQDERLDEHEARLTRLESARA